MVDRQFVTEGSGEEDIAMSRSIRNTKRITAKLFYQDTGGQALIETAIFVMVLALMLGIVANLGYAVYVGSTVTSASRQAVTFAAQGSLAPSGSSLPAINTACSVAASEVNGWLGIPGNQWGAYAASSAIGGSGWTNVSACAGNSVSQAPVFNPDPESAYFTIAAVKTNANLSTPLKLSLFGQPILQLPSTLYGRTIYVRQAN